MTAQQIKEQLQDDLRQNGFDTVRDVKIEEGLDSTGDESLFVWLLLENSLSANDLTWDHLKPLVDHTRRQVRIMSPKLYPYVRVRREKEWAEVASG